MNTSKRRLGSNHPFLINERSLKRLRDALRDLLPMDGGVQCSVETRERERLIGTAEEVLGHPNLERDPIVFLKLVTGKYPTSITLTANAEAGDSHGTLLVEVETKDDGEAGRWLERMERELEPLRLKGFWYTVKQGTDGFFSGSSYFFLLWVILVGSIVFLLRGGGSVGPDQMWLTRQDAQELSSKPNLTMDDIARRQLKNRLDGTNTIQVSPPSGKTLAWILPLIAVYLLTRFVVFRLLPRGVFEWGDQAQRYADMVKRRDFIVTLIWGSFAIEVAGAIWAASALG